MAQTADDSQSLRAFTPVLVLLAICILINYVDRGNLSIAAPLLKDGLAFLPRSWAFCSLHSFGPTRRCSLSAAGWWTALT